MLSNFAILDLSTTNLVIILGIVVLLFGTKKLPELSRSIGESARELKSSLGDVKDSKNSIKRTVSDFKSSSDRV